MEKFPKNDLQISDLRTESRQVPVRIEDCNEIEDRSVQYHQRSEERLTVSGESTSTLGGYLYRSDIQICLNDHI